MLEVKAANLGDTDEFIVQKDAAISTFPTACTRARAHRAPLSVSEILRHEEAGRERGA